MVHSTENLTLSSQRVSPAAAAPLRFLSGIFACHFGSQAGRDLKPFDPPQRLSCTLELDHCSHTDFSNLPVGKRKPLLDSAKKNKLGAPGREASHAWHFFFFFSFGLCIIKLGPNALKWIISNTESSYFGVLLRFQRLRSHCAPALRLPRSAARPSYYS